MIKKHLFCLISILLFGAGVSCGEEPAARTRWEYKIWVQPDDVHEISKQARIERELNDLGSEGWELVSVVWKKHPDGMQPQGRMIHYFKRALVKKPTVESGKSPSENTGGEGGSSESSGDSGAEPEKVPDGTDRMDDHRPR